MTTVTEAAKRVGMDVHPLERATLSTLKEDVDLAQQLARRLVKEATRIAPEATWSAEELLAVLEVAAHGRIADADRVVEGRHLRKRIREHCLLAERYGEPFGLVVVKLHPGRPESADFAGCIASTLRARDRVSVYRTRIAFLFGDLDRADLAGVADRVAKTVDSLFERPLVLGVVSLAFPAEGQDAQGVLDWLEDALRPDP